MAPVLAKRVAHKGIVICGIRPEHFKDTAAPDAPREGARFTAPIDQTEWLGNEQYAYIPFEAEPSVLEHLDELEKELDGEGARTQLVVNLSTQSRIVEGDDAELIFDPRQMHVFDPESGENFTRDDRAAQQIATEQEELRKRALERARERDGAEQERDQR